MDLTKKNRAFVARNIWVCEPYGLQGIEIGHQRVGVYEVGFMWMGTFPQDHWKADIFFFLGRLFGWELHETWIFMDEHLIGIGLV